MPFMPKITSDFDPETYAPVAERIELFYQRFPTGRILTELVQHTEQEIVFRAAVFRAAEDREPAATGWAAERVGDGEVNAVACLENTETSAIGRALANLGFLASRLRPSAEEVAKAALHLLRTDAERAGPRLGPRRGAAGPHRARAARGRAVGGPARAPSVRAAAHGRARGPGGTGWVRGVAGGCLRGQEGVRSRTGHSERAVIPSATRDLAHRARAMSRPGP